MNRREFYHALPKSARILAEPFGSAPQESSSIVRRNYRTVRVRSQIRRVNVRVMAHSNGPLRAKHIARAKPERFLQAKL
jgi:hypothetical protein